MIKYKAGYKYQLYETWKCELPDVFTGKNIDISHISIHSNFMTICAGYAWDGPSGPAPDWMFLLKPSLVHDALYQLIRMGKLSQNFRKPADDLFLKLCLVNAGKNPAKRVVSRVAYKAVRIFAGYAALPKSVKPVLTAP